MQSIVYFHDSESPSSLSLIFLLNETASRKDFINTYTITLVYRCEKKKIFIIIDEFIFNNFSSFIRIRANFERIFVRS